MSHDSWPPWRRAEGGVGSWPTVLITIAGISLFLYLIPESSKHPTLPSTASFDSSISFCEKRGGVDSILLKAKQSLRVTVCNNGESEIKPFK